MALSATVLSGLIKANIDSMLRPDQSGQTQKLADAIAQAVVTHITSAAVVVPTLMIAPPTGGPVTGTGVVT